MKLYAEEISGEAAARRFSVDPKRVRDWRKNQTSASVRGGQQQGQAAWWREEEG